MPRERKEAPNATIRMNRNQDQRRAVEVEFDKKFPDRKHMWKSPSLMGPQVASGLLEVVKDKDGKEITNRDSVLCSMARERWEATTKALAEASYEDVKAYRGNYVEGEVPLRQFANFRTPREKTG